MKRLRLFGLLVTVLLLAFGLALGCDNGTTTTDDTEPLTTTFYDAANNITITFSNKAIEARARAAGPNDGDYYQIKRGSALLSSGTIQLQGNGTTIKFIEDSGATFTGQFLNNLLTINDTVGGQALTVSASTPGTSGGGGPSTGPSGGGSSPSGGGGGATSTGAKISTPWNPTFAPASVTDQGFTVSAVPSGLIGYNPGKQPIEYAAGLSTGSSPTTPWQKAPDFNGLDPEKEYTVWARSAAVTAAESTALGGDGNAYAAGVAVKSSTTVTTKAKGATGASITKPFLSGGTPGVSGSPGPGESINIVFAYPATVTDNPGTQPIEYAVTKTSSPAPTSGWQSSLTFTGLDPATEYYIWARTAYKPAVGSNPAYSAGPAERGDQPVTTTKRTGSVVGPAAAGGLATKPAAEASNANYKTPGGELYVRAAQAAVLTTPTTKQDFEYTFSTAASIAAADAGNYVWWEVGEAAKTASDTQTATLVGLSNPITLTEDDGGLVFKGLRGRNDRTANSYNVYARSKANAGYAAGDPTPLGNAAIPVLIPAPAVISTFTVTLDTPATNTKANEFKFVITEDNSDGKALTSPWISTIGTADFEYVLVDSAGNLVDETGARVVNDTWVALADVTAGDTPTGLATGTYNVWIRVKENAGTNTFAQGTADKIGKSSTGLATLPGTDPVNNLTKWEPTAPSTLKGLQFTVGGIADVDDKATPTPGVVTVTTGMVEYGVTLATPPATTGMILGADDLTDVTFEGLEQGKTYYLWARLASTAAAKTGDWKAATGAAVANGVKTANAAVATSTDLAAISFTTRLTDRFTVSGIPATVDSQDWEFAVTTNNSTTSAPTTGWGLNSSSITGSFPNRAMTITELKPGTTYYVWIRAKALADNYDIGAPKLVTSRGVTKREAANIGPWLDANIESVVLYNTNTNALAVDNDDQTETGVKITFKQGVTSLPALSNGQTVSFGVSIGGTVASTAWVPANTIVNGANAALTTIVQAGTDGAYQIVAKVEEFGEFVEGAAEGVSGDPIDLES